LKWGYLAAMGNAGLERERGKGKLGAKTLKN